MKNVVFRISKAGIFSFSSVKSGRTQPRHLNYPRAIFSFLLENFSCLISHFLLSAKKKFVTKFVTRITKFVTCVRKFVTAVTKFVIKNILAGRKKYQGERKKYQGEKKNFQAANGCGLRGACCRCRL